MFSKREHSFMLVIIFPSDMFCRIFTHPMGIHVSMIYWSPMIDNWNRFALVSAQWNFCRYSSRKCSEVTRIVLFRLARRMLWEWIGGCAGVQCGSNYRSTQRPSEVKATSLPNFKNYTFLFLERVALCWSPTCHVENRSSILFPMRSKWFERKRKKKVLNWVEFLPDVIGAFSNISPSH